MIVNHFKPRKLNTVHKMLIGLGGNGEMKLKWKKEITGCQVCKKFYKVFSKKISKYKIDVILI